MVMLVYGGHAWCGWFKVQHLHMVGIWWITILT